MQPLPDRPASEAVRVLVVEDHRGYRQGLQEAIAADERLELVAAAADGIDGLELASRRRFDVAVVDLGLPGMSGIELCRRMVRPDGPAVLAISGLSEPDIESAALAAGAAVFLPKEVSRSTVCDAIARLGRAV